MFPCTVYVLSSSHLDRLQWFPQFSMDFGQIRSANMPPADHDANFFNNINKYNAIRWISEVCLVRSVP